MPRETIWNEQETHVTRTLPSPEYKRRTIAVCRTHGFARKFYFFFVDSTNQFSHHWQSHQNIRKMDVRATRIRTEPLNTDTCNKSILRFTKLQSANNLISFRRRSILFGEQRDKCEWICCAADSVTIVKLLTAKWIVNTMSLRWLDVHLLCQLGLIIAYTHSIEIDL